MDGESVISPFLSPNAMSIARGDLFGKKGQGDDMTPMTPEGIAAQRRQGKKL